jgi:hypothetical protein
MAFSRTEVMHARSSMPLVERGQTEKTFFGLRAFAATVSLLGAAYLMVEALLSASDMGALTAGFALALATFLSVYLLSPKRRIEHGDAGKERARPREVESTVPDYVWRTSKETYRGDTGVEGREELVGADVKGRN